jgi:hypothetical protein
VTGPRSQASLHSKPRIRHPSASSSLPGGDRVRMSVVVGGDGKAQSRVGTCTAGMILSMWLEAR